MLVAYSRRTIIVSATAILGIAGASGQYGRPEWSPKLESSRAEDYVPTGLLDRATEPPDLSIDKPYSTNTMPVQLFDEDCRIPVYPWAINSESALSHVLVSRDLNLEPNRVLVQRLTYSTEKFADSSFERISRDAIDIFGTMMLAKPEPHESDMPSAQKRRFQLAGLSGWNKALHIERRGVQICIVRAGASAGPPWEFVDQWVELAFADKDISGAVAFEGSEWHLSYGPFDFHPSAYESPACS